MTESVPVKQVKHPMLDPMTGHAYEERQNRYR